MIIYREITPTLLKFSSQFPVIAIMGPRQSGKTTLAKEIFKSYAYVSLENLDARANAKEDPKRFFASYAQAPGVIIDEIQEVPELLSYMQGIIDEEYKPGYFIITGSQNFLLLEKITQTLAGRIAILTLLPLTIEELKNSQKLPNSLETVLYQGLYPRIYSQPSNAINSDIWLSNYITTYAERDIKQILNIGNTIAFRNFLKLCAARVGNLINFAELARDAGISPNTAKAWLSVLESSYIIKLLQPYYKNFNKRVTKSPKLYFYDTGVVCSLLGIKSDQELFFHPMRGAIFETLIISELFKYYFNKGINPDLYFWRDVQGNEIDCIIEESYTKQIPIEIKSAMTVNSGFFTGLINWKKITKTEDSNTKTYIVYAGKENLCYKHADIIAWNCVKNILEKQ